MTRKHFVAIAKAIREMSFLTPDDRLRVAMAFAELCSQEPPILDGNGNRRFDRDRFLKACGVRE